MLATPLHSTCHERATSMRHTHTYIYITHTKKIVIDAMRCARSERQAPLLAPHSSLSPSSSLFFPRTHAQGGPLLSSPFCPTRDGTTSCATLPRNSLGPPLLSSLSRSLPFHSLRRLLILARTTYYFHCCHSQLLGLNQPPPPSSRFAHTTQNPRTQPASSGGRGGARPLFSVCRNNKGAAPLSSD